MELSIIERTYSSWSLRAWLAVELVGAPCEVRSAGKGTQAFAQMRRDNFPALTVPVLRFDDGAMVWESLSIMEELAHRHPEAGLWPEAPAARAAARALAGEMHAGFAALRRDCPMNLERRYAGFEPSIEVLEDVARIETLWTWAAERFGGEGPWLFGARPCAADLMFAPVIARFVTYQLGETEITVRLQDALYAWGPFRRWRAMGVAETRRLEEYELDLPEARRFAVEPGRKAANPSCPCSGSPVAPDALGEIEGRVIGFCNRFCRDRSLADADAWPKLAPLLA